MKTKRKRLHKAVKDAKRVYRYLKRRNKINKYSINVYALSSSDTYFTLTIFYGGYCSYFTHRSFRDFKKSL